MVIATGAFKDQTSPQDFEYIIPGETDLPVAFRQFTSGESSVQHKFDPECPLYINEEFIRRYPSLLSYILERYLEKNEYPLLAQEQIAKLPGSSKNEIKIDEKLVFPKFKEQLLQPLLTFTDSKNSHSERAKAVTQAILDAKKLDHIWQILENQYALFANDSAQGMISIPGLEAKWYSRQLLKKNQGDVVYLEAITNCLSLLPRFEPLDHKHQQQLAELEKRTATITPTKEKPTASTPHKSKHPAEKPREKRPTTPKYTLFSSLFSSSPSTPSTPKQPTINLVRGIFGRTR